MNKYYLQFMGTIAGATSIALTPVIVQAQQNKTITVTNNTRISTNSTESIDRQSTLLQRLSTKLKSQPSVELEKMTVDADIIPQNSFTQEAPTPPLFTSNVIENSDRSSPIPPFQPSSTLPPSLQKLANRVENANTPDTPISTGVKILSPTPTDVIDGRTTTVILQFPANQEIELRVNGNLVEKSSIGRTSTDNKTNLVTQTWYGVVLKEGENTITAQLLGSTESPATVKVMVSGAATQIKLETLETRIPADGRSTATVKGRLLDENGQLSNWHTVVTLTATDGEFLGADLKPDQPGFQLEAREGQFTAILKSGLTAKTVTIQAKTISLEAFTQLQLETALRPSLVTGVIDVRFGARGTDFFSSFRDFIPPDKDNGTQLNFRSAVFATGAIGEWLVTGAYDSSRTLNEDCDCINNNRLTRNLQFGEKPYPVYGDSSKVEAITSSLDSLYLRIERSPKIPGANPDYFMWGDYDTTEFSRPSQEFTAITRRLHGFKGNYNLGNLQITGFYANNVEGFQRDNLPPDGTSGYYFLSRRLIVPGSENIYVELEELNRPGTVLQRNRLARGSDYEIDYDRGTLLFREPILRTDVDENGQVLVRRIVATYEYESTQSSDSNIFGGRLQYSFARGVNQESWLGATYIREDKGVRDFELYGADALISLGSGKTVIAEYAHSTNKSDVAGLVSGSAWRVEAQGEIFKGLQGRAYYRTADTGFANNATISFVPGQTRYGAQLTGKITNSTNLRFQYDREVNNGVAPQVITNLEDLITPRVVAQPGSKVDNSLTTISAGIQHRIGKATVNIDWLHRNRKDNITNTDTKSNQLRSRLTFPIAKKLTFLAQNELTLSSEVDTVYPDKTIFGLNWTLLPGINLSLTQQFYSRGQFSGNSLTNLSLNGEHKLGTDTTITGRYSIIGAADGMTGQGAVGLKQNWNITPGLRMDFAYERVFGNFFGKNGTGIQFAQPFAVGQSAASLGLGSGDSYSVGIEYVDSDKFKASARFQHRNSSSGSNTVISAAATGKISPALTALLSYQQASSSNQKLQGLGDTAHLKLGLAYRNPKSDKFNALLRYEYRKNPSTLPETVLLGTGTGAEDHTFGLEAIYAPNWRWEFYGKYALRNSKSYLANDLVGTTTANLAQLRATYRLGYSLDLVGEARWINQGNYTENGFVLEAGYYLSPNLRLAAGYAFGNVSDRDFSGTRSAGGPYLGVTLKLNELFNGFGLQKVTPRQQQESVVKKEQPQGIW